MDQASNLVKEVADEYSNYFKVDTSEVVKQFDNSIEENLIILEDFCALLDVIRNENTSRLEHLLPEIAEKSKQMETLFSKIDKLELFVKMVKDQVNQMEEELIKAEEIFASKSKVKQFISSLLNNSKPKSPTTPPNKRPTFGFNDIFKTQDYIDNRSGQSDSSEFQQGESSNSSEIKTNETSEMTN
ncbi:biogenesis of lysosome-related organelles complex 1 subunit 4-like [Panonychus citri]|uniref:biogenesis of lysosome-related organelles complex 1 subunit 4-like n=1 Tax=Panonychus citri TaxID=50023 RepID=UPI002307A080|nr:biogenesis of lysosome-related organelles complex 1 subunit 4-like [Panonychus citri]